MRSITPKILAEYLDLKGYKVLMNNHDAIMLEVEGNNTYVLFHDSGRVRIWCHYDLHGLVCDCTDRVIDLNEPGEEK